MKNKFLCIGLSLFLGVALLSACDSNPVNDLNLSNNETDESYVDVLANQSKTPHGKYNEGVVLVKASNFNSSMLGELKYDTVNQLYKNSAWYEVKLSNSESTEEAVSYLSNLNLFEKVDFDYVMGSDGEIESIDISSNPWSGDEKHLDNQGIKEAWKYLKKQGKNPGGSPDVIVAVIDTGVDYNHIDLRNNIWTNSAEIPNNGIDDDGNGYVDDYYGWNFVDDNNDPMDDNGHGTHVAGIVAAENNSIGSVGVAFNSKIMVLKAGNSSGSFNNSDIASAIEYAYMNGASVINMSFGGSSISNAALESLENAYNQCILVAAAGNDGYCNNVVACSLHNNIESYPACLPYVIGVMSCNQTCSSISSFSNIDHEPYNKKEYEVFACGEGIPSTWPGNKYSVLNGTSMAAPVISGMASVLRSIYSDRDLYSPKFIQSQIVNTSVDFVNDDLFHPVANLYSALTTKPKPRLSLYDYYVFDNKELSPSNDGDGVIDAGETIALGIELFNLGGVATDINCSISSFNGVAEDKYVDIETGNILLNDCGIYSSVDCNKLYDEYGHVIGMEKFFKFKIDNTCPNDYIINLFLNISYKDGLNLTDSQTYRTDNQTISILCQKGFELPYYITEDTVFTNDQTYLVNHDVTICTGVNVEFEEGCEILFYSSSDSYYSDLLHSPRIINLGNLTFRGTSSNRITIKPSEKFANFVCCINEADFYYCDIYNLVSRVSTMNPFYCNADGGLYSCYNCNVQGYTNDFIYGIADGVSKRVYSASEITFNNFINSYLDTNCYITDRDNNLIAIKNAEKSIFVVASGKSVGGSYSLNGTNLSLNYCSNCIFQTDRLHIDNLENILFSNIRIISGDKNVFMNKYASHSIHDAAYVSVPDGNNLFLGVFDIYFETITNYFDSYLGTTSFERIPSSEIDVSNCWPFVKDIEIYNTSDELTRIISDREFRIVVTFNQKMDTSRNPIVSFGTRYPYSDYKIKGTYINDYQWEGTYDLKATIEGGMNYFNVNGAFSTEGVESLPSKGFYDLNIDTTSLMSMSLQGFSEQDGIHLSWNQDDYDTIMGYNIYRSNEKDGYYTKINSSVIMAEENSFIDENAEPGKTYWYTFTVVFSDMTESAPAGKISCIAADTIAPNIYHTPVNQGYLNNNLVITCTASDNIGIQNVTLYYRAKGADTWKSLEMGKQNDKYAATIFGSELTLDGIEYYIVANDGYNTISKGSAENPYNVIIKDASSISRLGDVDGDGVITTKDALMIMQAINGDLLLSDDQFRRADLNSDGTLSSVEALRILQYINGNVSSLEM